MFYSVATDGEILLGRSLEVGRVVGVPLDMGVVRREREWGGVEGVDVCPHSVVFLFGDQSLCLEFLFCALIVEVLFADLLFSMYIFYDPFGRQSR